MRLACSKIFFLSGSMMMLSGLTAGQESDAQRSENTKPNFIIILTDDQGYNDLGCFGSETIKSPRLDRMAEEGMRFTSFYAQAVCGPSRGVLMTGRYPARIGGGWLVNKEEIMLPELLKSEGYITSCIGKWDMSQRRYQEGFVPNDRGFDYYFGTLGANDRGVIQLYRNREALHETDDMGSLTRLFTDEALAFIKDNRNNPFFLYLAHTMPHVKIDASPQFRGHSDGELYGDVIDEIDWNTGRIIDLLRELDLDKNTFLLFLSDNGPWASREDMYRKRHGGQLATGSAFPLRSSKGSSYEGGFRVPAILWGSGNVPEGIVHDGIVSSLDVLPTFAILAGARLPDDRVIDGFNQSELFAGKSDKSLRDMFFYHQRGEIRAVRKGPWKLMLPHDKNGLTPELYDLKNDISERINLADQYPEIVELLTNIAKDAPSKPDPPRR